MKNRIATLLFCLTTVSIGGSFSYAHHSNVAFEVNKIITVKGKVKEFQWTNPHTQLLLLVDDGKGGQTEWRCEGRAPGIMTAAGWSKRSFTPGEVITVEMSPAKDGSKTSLIARITKADGTILGNATPPVQ